jgi:hypothetical protein
MVFIFLLNKITFWHKQVPNLIHPIPALDALELS